jgi:V8-like Glu-specific endopeptidase
MAGLGSIAWGDKMTKAGPQPARGSDVRTHFLDRLPLDWSDPALRELSDLLARTFWDRRETVAVAQAAGLNLAAVYLDQPASRLWQELFDQARLAGRQRELVTASAARGPALASRLDELLAARPAVDSMGDAAGGQPAWQGFSPDGGAERIIVEDAPSLLGIAFLRRGLDVARAVCRLRVVLGDRVSLGSAFRIGPDLLLTNYHVLRGSDDATATVAEARFNYELDWRLREAESVQVACDPASIVGEAADDWAVIRAAGPIPAEFPALDVTDIGSVAVDDRVYIIQHPDGAHKMIGMHHNLVRHVDDRVVQYWTDTKAGSSGSPVFDERWRLVALHHWWVRLEAGGRVEYRNQGRRIDRVLARINGAGVGI